MIDSQSIRTADTVPANTRGYDAGKKVKGRKRFIVTDTLGLLLTVTSWQPACRPEWRPSFPTVDPARPPQRAEDLGGSGFRRSPGGLGCRRPVTHCGDRSQGTEPAGAFTFSPSVGPWNEPSPD
ncbi:transposase [Streptomyces sp. NPDC008238]